MTKWDKSNLRSVGIGIRSWLNVLPAVLIKYKFAISGFATEEKFMPFPTGVEENIQLPRFTILIVKYDYTWQEFI